jgi:hypothetical protein
MQKRYHQQLFGVLILTLEDREPRYIHPMLTPGLLKHLPQSSRPRCGCPHQFLRRNVTWHSRIHIGPIVERLLRLLIPGGNQDQICRYIDEKAITTLAMVADVSETTFAEHYPTIMPLLLNVLRNADRPEHHWLRMKAIAGRDIFRPDSGPLIELLICIQSMFP